MTIQEILKSKGTEVFSIRADATLVDVVKKLAEYNVGSLLVFSKEPSEGEPPAGIITERDILHACAADKGALSETRVAEVMTTELITGSPGDAVGRTMGLMTAKRIRHLPILLEGRLVGVVSIGDVVKYQHDQLAMENQFMKDYIQG